MTEQCRITEEHCITCGDEGVLMTVIELRDGDTVCADQQRARHDVAVDLVAPVAIGDELLVHAGVAIKNLGPRTAVGARG